MMNFNEEGYFQVENSSQNQIAFDMAYMIDGVPMYAYSKPYAPGVTKKIMMAPETTDIKFTIYMFNPPYQLVPIFKGAFKNSAPRCYSVSGNLQRYLVSRVLCPDSSNGNNGCNCSCNCCNCCSYYDSCTLDYNNLYNC